MILFSVPSCLTATFPQPTSLPTYSTLLRFNKILSDDGLNIDLLGFILSLGIYVETKITAVIVKGGKVIIKSYRVWRGFLVDLAKTNWGHITKIKWLNLIIIL